jgi:hypothetical protein
MGALAGSEGRISDAEKSIRELHERSRKKLVLVCVNSWIITVFTLALAQKHRSS